MTLLQLLRQRCKSCTDDALAATATILRDHGVSTTLLTQGGLSLNDMDTMHIHLNVGRAIVNAFGAPRQDFGESLSSLCVALHLEARTHPRFVSSTVPAARFLALDMQHRGFWHTTEPTVDDPLLGDRYSSIVLFGCDQLKRYHRPRDPPSALSKCLSSLWMPACIEALSISTNSCCWLLCRTHPHQIRATLSSAACSTAGPANVILSGARFLSCSTRTCRP